MSATSLVFQASNLQKASVPPLQRHIRSAHCIDWEREHIRELAEA
jgi:hypothetical protein